MSSRAYRFRLTDTGARHVEEIADWWRANRLEASGLFLAELARCLERLTQMPRSGTAYTHDDVAGLRRAILRATRCHVYYTVDEGASCIIVRGVWHASRGSPPELG